MDAEWEAAVNASVVARENGDLAQADAILNAYLYPTLTSRQVRRKILSAASFEPTADGIIALGALIGAVAALYIFSGWVADQITRIAEIVSYLSYFVVVFGAIGGILWVLLRPATIAVDRFGQLWTLWRHTKLVRQLYVRAGPEDKLALAKEFGLGRKDLGRY